MTKNWSVARVLRDRDAALYLAASSVSGFGTSALWLASGVWVKDLTGSNGLAALSVLALWVPTLLGPPLGTLADLLPRKPLLVALNLGPAALLLTLLAVDSMRPVVAPVGGAVPVRGRLGGRRRGGVRARRRRRRAGAAGRLQRAAHDDHRGHEAGRPAGRRGRLRGLRGPRGGACGRGHLRVRGGAVRGRAGPRGAAAAGRMGTGVRRPPREPASCGATPGCARWSWRAARRCCSRVSAARWSTPSSTASAAPPPSRARSTPPRAPVRSWWGCSRGPRCGGWGNAGSPRTGSSSRPSRSPRRPSPRNPWPWCAARRSGWGCPVC